MCMRGYNLYTTCKLIILFLLSASVNQYPFEDGVTHTLDTTYPLLTIELLLLMPISTHNNGI